MYLFFFYRTFIALYYSTLDFSDPYDLYGVIVSSINLYMGNRFKGITIRICVGLQQK